MFRLLIVEDEENSRKGLKSTLAPIPNLEIDTACDGREGCLKAIRWNPDIIISDIHMPVWDGLVMTLQKGICRHHISADRIRGI